MTVERPDQTEAAPVLEPSGATTAPQPSETGIVPFRKPEDIVLNWTLRQGKPANRYLSDVGGPTPAGANWYRARTPQPAQTSERLSMEGVRAGGKTQIEIAPNVPTPLMPEELKAPERQPGFFEFMLGGLVDAFTGIVPDPIRGGVVGVAQGIGQVLDIPGEFLGHVPVNQLFGLEDLEAAFKLMPMTDDKQRALDAMKYDSINQDWYMSQYLRTHTGDYAAKKKLPQVLANLIRPDATLQERFFTLLGVPSQMVSRTAAGVFERWKEILDDPDLSDPVLRELRDRYYAREFGVPGTQEARDRLMDEIVTAGYGWGDDPFISMLAEMVTDPIIVAGMVTGGAASAVRVGSLSARAANISRLARSAINKAGPLGAAVKRVDALLEAESVRTGRVYDLKSADSTYRFAKEFEREVGDTAAGRAVIDEATSQLSTRQQFVVRMSPVIEGLAKASEIANSPFSLFGNDGAAGLVRKKFARNTTVGMFAAFDMGKVMDMYGAMGDTAGKSFNEALGHALAYSQRALMQNNLIRTVRMHVSDAKGRIVGNAKLPDIHEDPTTVVDRMRKGDNPMEAQEMELHLRRVKTQYEPSTGDLTGEARRVEYDRQMNQFRDVGAQKLAHITGMSVEQAKSMTRKATSDELAFIDYAHFGKTISDLIEAQELDVRAIKPNLRSAAVDAVKKGAGDHEYLLAEQQMDVFEIANRATLIGPRELTMERALQIKKRVDAAKTIEEKKAILDEVIGKYEALYQNVYEKTRITSDEDLVKRVMTIIEDGLENDRFVVTLKPESLPDHLRSLRDQLNARGAEYEIGLAPAREKRWAPIVDSKGQLVGYYPWMDIRVTPEDVKAPTRFDHIRERLFQPIRGENIMQESRRRFIRYMNKDLGIGRAASITLWDAVREAARARRITMRGFSPDEFIDIIEKVNISPWERQHIGRRGLAMAVAVAMESDVAMVGLTSKLTGISKTRTVKWGNYMGQLSEKLYPQMRFNLNPMFQLQEFIEPYFFNLIRGVKMGFKFGPEQLSFHQLLSEMNMADHLADGFEAREFMMAGMAKAHMVMGPGSATAKVMDDMPYGIVGTAKRTNYYNLTRKLFGDAFHDALEKEFPGMWTRIEAWANEWSGKAGRKKNLNRGEVAELYFNHKGMANPDNAWSAIHHYDGSVPDHFGRIRGINASYLAKQFGYSDSDAIRSAAQNPLDNSITEWQVREQLVEQGFSSDYAKRAWTVLTGPGVEDVLDEMVGEVGDYADEASRGMAREMAAALLNRAAITKGVSVDEYVATKFAMNPEWVDANARLPYKAMTQLAHRVADEYGLSPLERTDERLIGMVTRAKELVPEEAHPKQAEHVRAAQRVADGTQKKSRFRVRKDVTVEGYKLHADGPSTDDFTSITRAVLDDASITAAGSWGKDIAPFVAGIAYKMDDVSVKAFADALDEVLPELGGRIGLGDVDEAIARVEALEAKPPGSWVTNTDAEFKTKVDDQTATMYGKSLPEKVEGGEQVIVHRRENVGTTINYYDENGDYVGYVAVGKGDVIASTEIKPSLRGKGYGQRMYDYIQDNTDFDLVGGTGRWEVSEAGKSNALKWLKSRRTKSLDAARQEIGARSLMAWASTQVQTSPREGWKFTMHFLDAVRNGDRIGAKKPGTYGMQRAQFEAMLRDFKPHLNMKGIGPKLYDFIDMVLDDTAERTMMRGVKQELREGRVMQPAAMDVWVGRDFGYVDSGLLTLLAKRIAKARDVSLKGASKEAWDSEAMAAAQLETGFFYRRKVVREVTDKKTGKKKRVTRDEPMEEYLTRKAEFEKEHGVELETVWDGTPSAADYETMLARYNKIADELNAMDGGDGWLGRGNNSEPWTAGDVQSIAWTRIQKQLDIEPDSPSSMFYENSAQVSWEVLPGENTPLAQAAPMFRAPGDAKDLITSDVAQTLLPIIEEVAGVQIIESVPGMGGWRGGPNDYTLSPNTYWNIHGSPEAIDDALDALMFLTQNDMVFATQKPDRVAGKYPMMSSDDIHWGIDFVPSDGDMLTLDKLARWLEDKGFDWNGNMVASRSAGERVVRTVYSPAWDGAPEHYLDIPKGTDLAGFEQAVPIPDDIMKMLEDGSWAKDAGMEDAVPVNIERDLWKSRSKMSDFRADEARALERIERFGEDPATVYREEMGKEILDGLRARGRGDAANALVGRHMATVISSYDAALKRRDGNAWSVGRGSSGFREAYRTSKGGTAPYPSDAGEVHLQRRNRGWLGATKWNRDRDASVRVSSGGLRRDRSGKLILKRTKADITTVVHELMHFFADDLDPSAVKTIHDAFFESDAGKAYLKKGGGKPKGKNAHTNLIVPAEEWLAAQFEQYVATGISPNGTMNAVFNDYADWMKQTFLFTPDVDPALKGLFDKMTPEMHKGPKATYNVDEYRVMEVARVALLRAEEEAFRAHYYKRGRSFIERSINHPYLGMYPASYMWGKVLPELMKFLVRQPFGVDAPFAGLQMVNHVFEAIQLDIQSDNESWSSLIAEHPEALFFLQMLIPGTPWDIPVNAPAWTRRIAGDAYRQKDPDFGRAISDTLSYAWGAGRVPVQVLDVVGDSFALSKDMAAKVAGEYVPPEERKEEEKRIADMRRAGVLPPEQQPEPRLKPEGVLPTGQAGV